MANKEFTLEDRTLPSGLVIPTQQENYNQGFKRGLFWPDQWNYRPGGPFIYSFKSFYNNTTKQEKYTKASQAAHDAWMKGWDDGNKSKSMVRDVAGIELPSWKE